jgi:hypothetical protein
MKKFTLLLLLVPIFGYIVAQHTISITLVTDRYASETTYELINTLTDEVLSSGGPWANLAANGTTPRTIAPIDVDGNGCYAFYIYDSYGDGICCTYGSGYYEVYYDGVLKGDGSDFGSVGMVAGMGNGCPDNEITLENITMSTYGLTNSNINVSGTVVSKGLLNLTSFDVTYKVNDGENVANFSKTCNVGIGGSVDFAHNIPFNASESGIYEITVFVSNPNGVVDDETDNTLTKQVAINTVSTPRKVLLEHFSTAACPNCPTATANLRTWTNTRPDIIWVTHHAGYYTDVMTIPENTELLLFFNDGGSTYAPAIMLDRAHLAPESDPGPVFYPNSSFTPGLMNTQLAKPAFVTVDIEGIYNPATRQIDLTVSGEFVGNIIENNLRLSVFIVEDGFVGTQSGATGSYTHDHVMRDAISATFGDQGVITTSTTGASYTKTFNYTHNAAWVPANLSIVAFVNNWDPTNVNNREVYNAMKIPVTGLVNINEIPTDKIAVFPNPAYDVLHINYVEGANISIVNNLGQIVYSIENAQLNNTIDLSNLVAGTYFVKVTKDQVSQNHKLVIVK